MRRLSYCFLLAVLLAAACGKSTEDQVRAAVGNFDNAQLGETQIQVEDLQARGDVATAEVTVKTAVKLRKKEGVWQVEEIRLGDRRWEKAEHLLAVLNAERAQAGRQDLERITQGLERYRQANSKPPQVSDFRALVDLLTPRFMDRIIRFDPWSRPYRYQSRADGYDLRSAGPDGLFDTDDDVVAESMP